MACLPCRRPGWASDYPIPGGATSLPTLGGERLPYPGATSLPPSLALAARPLRPGSERVRLRPWLRQSRLSPRPAGEPRPGTRQAGSLHYVGEPAAFRTTAVKSK